MNAARCDEVDYIQFLVAASGVFTCTEAARCQPAAPEAPDHDAFARRLRRQPPDTEALWRAGPIPLATAPPRAVSG